MTETSIDIRQYFHGQLVHIGWMAQTNQLPVDFPVRWP